MITLTLTKFIQYLPSILGVVTITASIGVTYDLINNAEHGKGFFAYTPENDGHYQAVNIHSMVFFAFLAFLAGIQMIYRFALPDAAWKHRVIGFGPQFSTTPGHIILWSIVGLFQCWTVWWVYSQNVAVRSKAVGFAAATRAIGMASSVQIGLTMLPVSRKNFLSQFLGINFDDGLKFHRLSGALSIWFALGHTMLYIITVFDHNKGGLSDSNVNIFKKRIFMIGVDPRLRKYENYMGVFGVVSMILFAWVGITALSYVRRRAYMWFYVNHFFVLAAIVFGFLHASPIFYNVIPGLILYTIDGVTRVMQTSRPHTITSVSKEPNGYIRLEIANFSPKVKPGQWVSINVPAIHKTDFHPFSVVGKDPETDSLILIVKPSDREHSWTRSDPTFKLTCHVQGPFGNLPDHFFETPQILIVCAGSGITGGISVANAALRVPPGNDELPPPSVRILWSTKHSNANEISEWQELIRTPGANERLHVKIHHTVNGDGSDRVDIDKVFGIWKGEIDEKCGGVPVSLFACGPVSFTHRVAVAAEVFKERSVHIEGFER
ncbi:ferric/cupric-chelate reductase [Blyttiomyces sp. JEL0837]|nr:ferric/cupric-chelate reductase [Blyttiomyces sp. JEL0837]